MPKNTDFDPDKAQKYVDEGGKSKSTLASKQRAEKYFFDFLKSRGHPDICSTSVLWSRVADLEPLLIEYFQTYKNCSTVQ